MYPCTIYICGAVYSWYTKTLLLAAKRNTNCILKLVLEQLCDRTKRLTDCNFAPPAPCRPEKINNINYSFGIVRSFLMSQWSGSSGSIVINITSKTGWALSSMSSRWSWCAMDRARPGASVWWAATIWTRLW